ncbi:MAG: 4-hydroxy-tetrahydrodipicolinate synthase [Cellulosilyticaceae bacterium]
MKKPIFTGSGVAIVTPFNETGVDFDRLGKLIDWHLEEGTDAIVICGTTGEAPTLPIHEHKEAIRYTVERVAKRIPVIAGAGSNDTLHSIGTSRYAMEAGADAILSVVPYYNKTSQKGLYEHFKTIAAHVDLPIILYNVPSRTVLDMQPATVQKLSQIENIVAIKECNFNHVAEIIHTCPDLAVYSGEDGNVLPLLALGGHGVISVMANVIPRDTHNLCQAFFDGNLEEARRLQLGTIDLVKALFMEPNPVPVKEALNLMGMEVGGCRLPLVGMEEANKEVLIRALQNYGLLK